MTTVNTRPRVGMLSATVTELAEELEVPGVAVGIHADGQEQYAFHGVTSVENPLPVDENTLFQIGSTGKTFTATVIMRLVEAGKIDLHEKVKKYVPELWLKDPDVEREVTVLHLLNHTAGWQGDLEINTGDGDDALAKYIALMADFEQETPLGAGVSYNNASLSLAGRVIEKVTGKVFEHVIEEMIFEPLGFQHSYFFNNEIMTRRFVAGHRQTPDGEITVARPWALTRGGNPAGGSSHTAADQIIWARFHLGDGRTQNGTRILSEETLKQMQEPTVETPGSTMGDGIGIVWMLRDADGVHLVYHGGTTNGQRSAFLMVPERGFAITSMTNSSPNGGEFNDRLVRWALEEYGGVIDRDPEPVALDAETLAAYTGRYETISMFVDVAARDGGLMVTATMKPEAIEKLRDSGEAPPDTMPLFPLGLLPGDGDRYITADGPYKGMKGYFTRGASGAVEGMHFGGRLALRAQSEGDRGSDYD